MLQRFKIGLAICLLMLSLAFVTAQNGDPLYNVPQPFAEDVIVSSTLDRTVRGRFVVANPLSDSISFINLAGEIDSEIAVGDEPRAVALINNSNQVLVLNRRDGTLSIVDTSDEVITATYPIGIMPHSLIALNDNIAIISRQGQDDVVFVDVQSGRIVSRTETPSQPSALIRWGDLLYVTHFWSGEISLIYIPTQQLIQTIQLHPQASLMGTPWIDARTARMYVPHSLSNTASFTSFDNRIVPIVSVVDLERMQVLTDATLNLKVIDRPANMPFAIKQNLNGTKLIVTYAGSDLASIIDIQTGLAEGAVITGSYPTALEIGTDGLTFYTHNTVDQTLTVGETRFFSTSDTIPTTRQALPASTLVGARLFHTANDERITRNNAMSCASCHFDGLSDGRTWEDLNTPTLLTLNERDVLGWQNTWQNVQALDDHIRNMQRGTGFGTSSLDLAALVAYMQAIPQPPVEIADDVDRVLTGQELYTALNCSSCHVSSGTSSLYDLNTDGEYIAPILRYLAWTAPYLHDGSMPDLETLFIYGTGAINDPHQLVTRLSQDEMNSLIAYLLSRNE